jgi:hypothetical protein
MDPGTLVLAIENYFRGERQEMFAILGGSLAVLAAAVSLYAVARDGFSRGFGVTTLVVALLLSSMAVSLLRRDGPQRERLLAGVRGPEASAVVRAEAARVDAVIRKYPAYRHAALALGLLALLAGALVRRGWVGGVAAGILLLVVAQAAIDHYSEARARRYAGSLAGPPAAGATAGTVPAR